MAVEFVHICEARGTNMVVFSSYARLPSLVSRQNEIN